MSGLGATRPVGLKNSFFGSNSEGAQELLLQALEIKIGGIKLYEAAIRCATNAELATTWGRDLAQIREEETMLRAACEAWGLDITSATPGRTFVTYNCKALVAAMENAAANAPSMGQLLAAECVVLWETMDGLRKQPLAEICASIPGKESKELRQAFRSERPPQTAGWAGGLWMKFVGKHAVLPPAEGAQDAKSRSGAVRAKHDGTRTSRGKSGPTGSRSGRSTTVRTSRTR